MFFSDINKEAKLLSDSDLSMQLLQPIDNEIVLEPSDNNESKYRNALAIRAASQAMIHKCDAVIANLSPFRGPEADVGTAYEFGYANALGKIFLCYSANLAELTEKYHHFDFEQKVPDGRFRYSEIEDFGLPFNLMLYNDTAHIFSNFR